MFSILLDFLSDLLISTPSINWRRRRDRGKEWSGTVEAKKARAVSHYAYLVTFRTEDGSKKKLFLERAVDFEIFQVGRRYVKRPGQDLPDPKPIG